MADSELKLLDTDLKELLVVWFGIGHLDLKQMTWSSPASILEKVNRIPVKYYDYRWLN